MNTVHLSGNLATDPTGRKVVAVRDGQRTEYTIASFLLAVNRPRRAAKDQDPGADFVRIEVWGKSADSALRYLKKGRRVNVEGRLRSSRWTTQDGQNRYDLRVIARRIEYWPLKNGAQAADQADQAGSEFEPAEEAEFDRVPF
jgi:single-strand DNA-binding protein